MTKPLLVGLLTLSFWSFADYVQGPPPPPGFTVQSPKPSTSLALQSPKGGELVKSLGTPLKTTSIVFPIDGTVITNIAIADGNVTLKWQGASLVQVQQSVDLNTWLDVGNVIAGNTSTFPKVSSVQQFYRLKLVTPIGPWAQRHGGPLNDSGQAVAIDGQGNVYVTGYFSGTASFGGSSHVSSGGVDMFLAKYSSSGAYQWSRSFGSTGNEQAAAIAIDTGGNIYVGGSMYFTCNFGGTNMTSAGDADAFLAKYDTTGTHIWSFRFGNNFPDVIRSLAVNGSGEVAVAGFFQGVVNVQGTTIFSWGNGIDPLLAKFSPNSTLQWVKNFYNAGTEYGNAVAFDAYDDLVMAGYFNGFINFAGGQTGPDLLKTPGGYLAKFTSNGDYVWAKAYGSPATRFWSMVLTADGDIAVGGDFQTLTDLGGGPITGTSWGLDMFVARFSRDMGTYGWAAPILGFQASVGRPVCMSRNGTTLTLTGYLQGQYIFGAQTLTSSPGVQDGFFAKVSDSGSLFGAQRFGSSGVAAGNGINRSVVSGFFSGSAGSLISQGANDVILKSN